MNGTRFTLRPWSRLGAFLSLIALVGLSTLTEGQQGGAKWEVLNNKATGNFIVALAQDLQGNIWVGTEDKGVFRYEPKAPGKQWTQFNSKNGLGDDNAYAIACDKLGRVWVGTLNHGVSVFNGKDWKNYDVLDGPIGERIFAIATCPTDGDVWMATSAGVTRYSLKNDTWNYYTRSDGLPEDQANAIAFDPQGNIYVGTQCQGIAIAQASSEYKKWAVVGGPSQLGVAPNGTGLPSNLINALLVNRDGTIYAGTTAGLAWSKDKGKTWAYLRGRDYDDKVKGRWGGSPAGWKAASKQVLDAMLSEDCVTCLAESNDGLLWIGFRQQGYLAIDPKTSKHVFTGTKKADGLPDDYVGTILPASDFRPWIASYGGGAAQARQTFKFPDAKVVLRPGTKLPVTSASLPSPAKPPSLEDLKLMLAELGKVPDQPPKQLAVVSLNDDWKTQGTWIDRYGNFAGVLCAMGGNGNDLVTGYRASWSSYRGWLGRNCSKGDQLRYWVHWITTTNPRSLQNPVLGGRKQAEWDDHGEEYPMSKDGPHEYATLRIPKGQYILSLYFFNKDGHEGMNRFRDYRIEVKPTAMVPTVFDKLGTPGVDAEALFEQISSTVAHGRVSWFWGGVYKRYYVSVPESSYYTIRIHRNNSFNTILSAVFVDPVGELCGPKGPIDQPAMPRQPRFIQGDRKALEDRATICLSLGDRLLCLRDANPLWYTKHSRPYLLQLMKALLAEDTKEDCLAGQLEKTGKHKDLRQDYSRCLNDLQLFDRRDRVHFSLKAFASFRWEGITKGGEGWQWDKREFDAFLNRKLANQSWQP